MMRQPVLLAAAAAAAILLCQGRSHTFAQNVTTVEEDWVLVVDEPLADRSSPQVNCLIAPGKSLNGPHAVFLVNQRNSPVSAGGGLQLQLWNGPTLLAVQTFPHSDASLYSSKEEVTWTTRLSVLDGVMTVQVLNGQSTTWGDFSGELVVSAPTAVADLSDYDPNFSASQSGVDYGEMRVEKLALRKVRLIDDSGKAVEHELDLVVFQNH